MGSKRADNIRVGDRIIYQGKVAIVKQIDKDPYSWEVQFLIYTGTGKRTLWTEYIRHGHRVETVGDDSNNDDKGYHEMMKQNDRDSKEYDKSGTTTIANRKFDTPDLNDDQDRTAHQKYRLRSMRGTMKVYSTKDKMHKITVGDFFAIVKKGENIFDWHWYMVMKISREDKTLLLKSLQTEKEYAWKFKGGEHYVIPTK